jgi:hypothetical protein
LGLLLLLLYFLQSAEWTDKDLLSNLVEMTNHLRYRNQVSDSINNVIFTDQQIKTHYLEFQENVQQARKSFHNEPKVKVYQFNLGTEKVIGDKA